jgi:hypothetical protein
LTQIWKLFTMFYGTGCALLTKKTFQKNEMSRD